MIAHLSGKIRSKSPNRVVVDVGGVGYEVALSLSSYTRLPQPGEPVEMHVHTHVAEGDLALFGFLTVEERETFRVLIRLSGIGPRLALGILGGIEPPELCRAIISGDIARLARLPGIGKKTGERMVLELKDVLLRHPVIRTAERAVDEQANDVLSALVNMGYRESPAQKATAQARKELPNASFDELLREALSVLRA